MNFDLKYAFLEMLRQLESNHLKVVIVPQKEPTNCGASIRIVEERNCEWYREFCSEFPSNRKTRSIKFKTKIKRRNVIRLLKILSSGKKSKSKYVEILTEYAQYEINKLKQEIENG